MQVRHGDKVAFEWSDTDILIRDLFGIFLVLAAAAQVQLQMLNPGVAHPLDAMYKESFSDLCTNKLP